MNDISLWRHTENVCKPGLWAVVPHALFEAPSRAFQRNALSEGHTHSVLRADACVDDFGTLVVVGVSFSGALQ